MLRSTSCSTGMGGLTANADSRMGLKERLRLRDRDRRPAACVARVDSRMGLNEGLGLRDRLSGVDAPVTVTCESRASPAPTPATVDCESSATIICESSAVVVCESLVTVI